MQQFQKDKLMVRTFSSRDELGKAAAADAAGAITRLLREKETIAMIFAAAPSQDEFLKYLSAHQEIDFSRIYAFHMDEYIGLDKDAPQGFGNYLKANLFGKRRFRSVEYINGQSPDPQEECRRYTEVLRRYPIDIVCMGIGENGHIAFNDPQNADFHDPQAVKVVQLDPVCRQQQVNDGCFASLGAVPETAMTLTVPTLMKADYHFCMVPTGRKAQAVHDMVRGEISEKCPASALRTVSDSILYLDEESASLL